MTDDRTLTLAERLRNETETNNLEWVKSSSANSYRLSLGTGMVVLDLLFSSNNVPYYSFSVLNERSTPIDNLTADSSDPSNYKLLKDIYEKATNRYLKKDETFESMFDALDLPF